MPTFVAILFVEIHLHNISSLKAKRTIVRSIRDRLCREFNVSVTESGRQDSKDWVDITVCGLASDIARADSLSESIITFIEREFPHLDLSFGNDVIKIK